MDKKHRIFIAINLPDNIKGKLIDFQKKWADSRLRQGFGGQVSIRWTKPENIHITLVFIGYVASEQVADICRAARKVVENSSPFDIRLERICLGPPQGPPRMIWLEGARNRQFTDLKNNLENALLDSKNSGYNRRETREFHPHITLGRFKYPQSRATAPKIDIEFNESFTVKSIEVMESALKRSGAEYTIFESIGLGR